MASLAPVVLFTYKRSATLKSVVESLAQNIGASETDLIIYSDGPKSSNDLAIIKEVRSYLQTISGFRSVHILQSSENKGLARSIIEGVSEVLVKFGKAIVLEDDLITSKNFIVFMNQALTYYADNPKILSISGYSPVIPELNHNEVYFTRRLSSWGWAIWYDKWKDVDWDMNDYENFRMDRAASKRFNSMGSDLTSLLRRQMEGKLDSWAIRLTFHQFRKQLYTVYPSRSKVQNIGFNDSFSTHTKELSNRFVVELDNTQDIEFKFNDKIYLETNFLRHFLKPSSIYSRLLNKLNRI